MRPRSFSMQRMAGAGAGALVCLCLLYIIFVTIPAHASTGSRASALIPFDTGTASPTDTTTPSPTATSTPTATNTPSPTGTTNPTTTPGPSPSATRPVSPSPTTGATVGATATTSPAVGASPGASPATGATPTDTQATNTNQGPGSSFTQDNSTGDSSNSGDNPLVDALLIILLGGGASGLLVLLFVAVRIFLRRRLVPLPSPKLPPSGAAPWSRSPVGAQEQPDQSSPYAPMDDNPFYTPAGNSTPFPGAFNAAPTQMNTPPAWNQQPFPNTPPLLPGNVSADMMVVSNPYSQATPNQDSQQGQIVQQVPEEFSERW